MATEDTLKTVRFSGGIDSKPAAEDVLPTKLQSLTNATFDADGSIEKRGAITLIDGDTEALGAESARLAAKHGDELLFELEDGTMVAKAPGFPKRVVSVDPALVPGFTVASKFTRASVSYKQVKASSKEQSDGDFALVDSGGEVYVGAIWSQNGELHYQITRDSTDSVVVTGAISDNLGSVTNSYGRGRVVAPSKMKFFFYYAKRNIASSYTSLCMRSWSPGDTALSAETVLINGGTLTELVQSFDVNCRDSTIALGWISDKQSILGCLSSTDGYTFTAKGTGPAYSGTTAGDVTDPYVCAIPMPEQNKVSMIFRRRANSSANTELYGAICSTTAGNYTRTAPAGSPNPDRLIGSAATGYLNRITAYVPESASYLYFAYELDYSTAATQFDPNHPLVDVRGGKLDLSTLVGTSDAILARGCTLACDLNDDLYCGVTFCDDNTAIISLAEQYAATVSTSYGFPSKVLARFPRGDSPVVGNYNTPLLDFQGKYYGAYYQLPPGLTSEAQLLRFVVDFDYQLNYAELAKLTYLPGGCPYVYDGKYVAEENFNSRGYIELFLSALGYPATSPGVLTNDSGDASAFGISFVVVLEWYDAQGNRHQSEPSDPYPVIFSGSTSYAKSIVARYCKQTWKAGVKLVLYRTLPNLTVYYRDSEYNNDVTGGTTALLTATLTNSQLASQETLYTTGGFAANEPMPSCDFLAVHQKRLLGCGLRNPYGIFVCMLPNDDAAEGDPPRYSSELVDYTSDSFGALTGLATLEDKLLIFGNDNVGYNFGDGANIAGTGSTYTRPAVLATGLGCPRGNQMSIIPTPDGVWFGSSAGLRFVTRGLAIATGQDGRQMGSEMDAWLPSKNSGSFVGSCYRSARQQVMFYTSNYVLVYDDFWKQWSRFISDDYTGVRVAIATNDVPYHVDNETLQLVTFSDTAGGTDMDPDGSDVLVRFRTAFFQLDQLLGYVRAKRVQVLYRNCTTLKLRVYVDYQSSVAYTEHVLTVTDSSVPSAFEHHIVQQKCKAIAFEIEESSASASKFSGLTLKLGFKKGTSKLPSTARMTPNSN